MTIFDEKVAPLDGRLRALEADRQTANHRLDVLERDVRDLDLRLRAFEIDVARVQGALGAYERSPPLLLPPPDAPPTDE
ncbi:hypothetical protein [Rubrivirga sp.]|uniref:hypothetical protein n=1 Tax=Rubrivirga sp. TaxID=1885344 RepID=UPI003B5222FE